MGCSCLEKELLGQVGRKDFSGHTDASGNSLWKKHQEMVNRNQVSLDSTITTTFFNPNHSLNEKERHTPAFALYFASLKLWDGFWLLSIRYCFASLEVGPTDP